MNGVVLDSLVLGDLGDDQSSTALGSHFETMIVDGFNDTTHSIHVVVSFV